MTLLYDLAQQLDIDPGILRAAAIVAVLLLALSIYLVIKAYRLRAQTGAESLIGSTASVIEWQGKKGRIHVQGEQWAARAETVLNLKPEDKVYITAVEDLTLIITAV